MWVLNLLCNGCVVMPTYLALHLLHVVTWMTFLVLLLYTIFESSSLARVSCFLMLLWVLKAILGLFGKTLESSSITLCLFQFCIPLLFIITD